MASEKTKYTIQVVIILSIFFFVLFNLIFKLIMDLKSEEMKKKAEQLEKQRIEESFVANIDVRYQELLKLYQAKEYDEAINIIKEFNKHDKSDYKDLPEMKKQIRLFYLKRKIESIPKIQLNEYLQLSKDIEIEEDDSTEVFIRKPRYGQYFYTSDLPITLEGTALSVKGDFSESLVWESDRDGVLGKGKQIAARLSFGEHQITATGSNGATFGKMMTRIFIEEDPEFLHQRRAN